MLCATTVIMDGSVVNRGGMKDLEDDFAMSSGAGGCAGPYKPNQGIYGDKKYKPFSNAYT